VIILCEKTGLVTRVLAQGLAFVEPANTSQKFKVLTLDI
jgi:hypothetical protein